MGKVITLIVGRSGSGKTSVVNKLEEKYGLTSVCSYTTRPKRYEDEQGHIFVNTNQMPLRDEMVAYTYFNHNHYWATSEQVDNADLYVIDPKGIEYFKRKYNGNKKVIVVEIYQTPYICQKRMEQRGDNTYNITSRLINDNVEFANFKKDITVINNDLETTADTIYNYIKFQECVIYDKVIYISHPYGGKSKNEKKVGKLINSLQKQYPNYLFISPIHAFSYAYHKVEYQKGLNMCLWLLNRADEMWVYGDWENSVGCCAEIDFCKTNNINYKIKENVYE